LALVVAVGLAELEVLVGLALVVLSANSGIHDGKKYIIPIKILSTEK
jgi:hypothetical protein